MARIVASPRVACSVAAAVVLIASHTGAASQALDPGWQLVYAGQPGYDDGLIESMFGDGTGQAIVGRAYQPPAPIYSEADPTAEPAPEPSAQERAPVSPQLSQQQPAPVAATRHARRGRPAPVYYQLVPAQQARAAGQGPVYYQQAPAQFAVAPPAPASGWRAVPQARRASRPAICRVGVARTAPRLAISAGGLSDSGRPAGANRSSVHRFGRDAAGSYYSADAGELSDGGGAARAAKRSICCIGTAATGPRTILDQLSGGGRLPSRRVSAARPVPAAAGPSAACVRIHNATAAGLCVSDAGLRPVDLWGHGAAAAARSAL